MKEEEQFTSTDKELQIILNITYQYTNWNNQPRKKEQIPMCFTIVLSCFIFLHTEDRFQNRKF